MFISLLTGNSMFAEGREQGTLIPPHEMPGRENIAHVLQGLPRTWRTREHLDEEDRHAEKLLN